MANCQKCGAALPPGAAACEYCGSVADVPRAYPTAGADTAREQGTASLSAPCFKRVSVGVMVVCAIITLGLYLSMWFFVRRKQLAELSPKVKSSVFGGLLGIHIFYLLGSFAYWGSPDAELFSAVEMFGYVLMGAMIYSAIIVRAALAEFAASRIRDSKFAGSIVWAVIFNALYLQSQINRMLDARLLGEAS